MDTENIVSLHNIKEQILCKYQGWTLFLTKIASRNVLIERESIIEINKAYIFNKNILSMISKLDKIKP